MIVRNREGLIKALLGYTEFTYGGHVEASLFDTTTKKAYLGGVYGEVSFNKDGLILFASIGQIGSKGTRFYSPKSLSPLLSLYIGGVWCAIETKLLRGED